MRKLIGIILLAVIAIGIALSLEEIPFGLPESIIGDYFNKNGVSETGAINMVTSIVVSYRGFDTLGEITVLFTVAVGLGALLAGHKKRENSDKVEPSSLI